MTNSNANTLPDMIEVDEERFFKTSYTNITGKGHFWGEGITTYEYWREGKDDARLHVRTINDYYID